MSGNVDGHGRQTEGQFAHGVGQAGQLGLEGRLEEGGAEAVRTEE